MNILDAAIAVLSAVVPTIEDAPDELVSRLRANAAALGRVELEWTYRRVALLPKPELDQILGVDFDAEPGVIAPSRSECLLDMPRYRINEEFTTRVGEDSESLRHRRMCHATAFDGERCYSTFSLEMDGAGKRFALAIDPVTDRIAKFGDTPAWGTSYLDAAGFVTSCRFPDHSASTVRSRVDVATQREVLRPGVASEGLAARLCVLEVTSSEGVTRFTLDHEHGDAVVGIEVLDADGSKVRSTTMSELRLADTVTGQWVPWQIDVVHQVSRGRRHPANAPLFRESYRLHRFAIRTPPPASFVLAPASAGMSVFVGDRVNYLFPATVAELDRAILRAQPATVAATMGSMIAVTCAALAAIAWLAATHFARARQSNSRCHRPLGTSATNGTAIALMIGCIAGEGPTASAQGEACPPPMATLDARQLRAQLLETADAITTLTVVYEITGYESDRAPADTYFHKELIVQDPIYLHCHTGHGYPGRSWIDDPYRQMTWVSDDRVTNAYCFERSYFVAQLRDDATLPGSLATEHYLMATGLWPCRRRATPRMDGEPVMLRDVGRDDGYDTVRRGLEFVAGRWCHVLEKPGKDALWIDAGRGGCLVARQVVDPSSGRVVRTATLSRHEEIGGFWLPRSIEVKVMEGRGDAQRRERASRIEVAALSIARVPEERFNFAAEPGSVEMDTSEAGGVARQVVAGGVELLEEYAGWSRRVPVGDDERVASHGGVSWAACATIVAICVIRARLAIRRHPLVRAAPGER